MLAKQVAVIALVVTSLAALPTGARGAEPSSPPPATPEELAHQLIQLTGGGNLGKQVMVQMIDSFRQANPKVPEAFWDEFLASVDPKQLEEIAVPIYVKNLTSEEMSAAIQFYSTPVGQSLVRKLPAIMQQSMAAGQEWGQRLAMDVLQRLGKYKETHPDV